MEDSPTRDGLLGGAALEAPNTQTCGHITEISPVSNLRRWTEVVVVTLFSFGKPLLAAIYYLIVGPPSVPFSGARAISGILNAVLGLLVLGCVLRWSGRRLRDIGVSWSLRDIGIGAVLAVGSYLAYEVGANITFLVNFATHGALGPAYGGRSFYGHPGVATIVYMNLAPVWEELIVRAYLMTEIIELTGSEALAVAVSVILQSSYHLYYGWRTALSIVCTFLVFALYFARTRRALPVIVAHVLLDIHALIWLL